MQIFLRGFVFIFTNGAQILMTDAVKQANSAMKSALFGLSPLLVFGLLIAIGMMIVYRYTAFGRKVQAVGCNKSASVKLGINVNMITALCFIICGALAGVAGILTATNVGMVHPSNIGSGMEFLAITACVLGGTSLLGGTGTIIPGTLIGVIFLNSIENGLGLLGASAYAYPVVRGLVIYLAMLTDSFKHSMFVNK
jgi:ribose transport system permease protein